ncbi:MAG: sigma-70 family RNA polymerase sigma factor [Planctomycetota bacterium]
MNRARERAIDELLVLRCQAGDQKGFDLLVHRWQRPIWRHARRLTGCDTAAWDVTQEVWLAVLAQLRRLQDPAWFAAWLFRIVRNKSADHVRRAERQRILRQDAAEHAAVRAGAPLDPSAAQERRETHALVAAALAQLPPESRELLTLRYEADLSTLELAVVLGIPAGTVKSRLHEAREQLKRILKGVCT